MMNFQKYTYEYLLATALSTVPNTVDKRQGSIIYDALSPACYALAFLYMDLQSVSNKFDIENLESVELEKFIYERTAITRILATAATGVVTFYGTVGTIVPLGTRVGTEIVNYMTTQAGTIGASGNITLPVECEVLGLVGNTPSDSITKLVSNVANVSSISNELPLFDGVDTETDRELILRYYSRLRNPGKAGNAAHYKEWATSVLGVGDAQVHPAWDGPLTVKVVITDGNMTAADPQLVDEVADKIEQEKPFGSIVTVVSATEKVINVEVVDLIVSDQYSRQSVIDNITNEIVKYLRESAFNLPSISYAKIGGIVVGTPGVLDYAELTLNNGHSNVELLSDEVPILGTIIM